MPLSLIESYFHFSVFFACAHTATSTHSHQNPPTHTHTWYRGKRKEPTTTSNTTGESFTRFQAQAQRTILARRTLAREMERERKREEGARIAFILCIVGCVTTTNRSVLATTRCSPKWCVAIEVQLKSVGNC